MKFPNSRNWQKEADLSYFSFLGKIQPCHLTKSGYVDALLHPHYPQSENFTMCGFAKSDAGLSACLLATLTPNTARAWLHNPATLWFLPVG